jgi:MFS family permease
MVVGSLIARIPQEGWKPAGYIAPVASQAMITSKNVVLERALRTPQFYLLWLVLCLNVTAGIGVIGQASLMIQDIFGVTAVAAAGFVGLISLFNMGGRIFWASLSDFIGRKRTYAIFFIAGAVLYAFVPTWGHLHAVALFVLSFLLIISMYGGGFATIPAYLRDLFGTYHVSAIHGRLLTAWSVAGVLGPVLVNYMREYEIAHGADKASAYQTVLHVMAALLVVGFVANFLVRPVDQKYWMPETKS